MTEAERELDEAHRAELSALELASTAVARVRFLEQRVDDLTRDLLEARRVLAALCLAGPATVSRRALELVDPEPILRTWTDPATGNLVIASP